MYSEATASENPLHVNSFPALRCPPDSSLEFPDNVGGSVVSKIECTAGGAMSLIVRTIDALIGIAVYRAAVLLSWQTRSDDASDCLVRQG